MLGLKIGSHPEAHFCVAEWKLGNAAEVDSCGQEGHLYIFPRTALLNDFGSA